MNLDFFVVILTGLAVIVPFTIPWLEKKDKLKKTVYLIELIKTKDELTKIIKQVEVSNNSPILLDKLTKNLHEIEDDINSSRKKIQINAFYLLISVEIFFLFTYFSNIIIQKSWESGLHFLEGVLSYPAMRIGIILFIIVVSFILTIKLSSLLNLKNKIERHIFYYFTMIGLFNVVLLVIGIFTYLVLLYSDPFVSWY